MRHVELGLDAIGDRPELTVLFGIAADRPETSYGWIEPGTAIAEGVFSVRRFWEKPHAELAGELFRRGCLWNSFVLVARASTLLGLFVIAALKPYSLFKRLRGAFGTTIEHQAFERLYEHLPTSSFSDDILTQHAVNLAVLPVRGVLWNDLGEPERVVNTLARLGVQQQWHAA